MGSGQGVRKVKVFVSSPGDVGPERERIDLVVRRLNQTFAELVHVETIRWERKFYSSHSGFQDQIPPAAGSDLVISIFWSRLGTPLPESFARMESGERYPSGSAYEVLTAIDERKKGDRPDVYVFRKTEPPIDTTDEAKAQWMDLNGFFARWFQAPDGQFLRAYHRFQTADELELQVDKLLRDWIEERVPRDQSLIWPIETKGSPFRALLPFDAKHAAIYFGRDRKITRTVEQLQSVAQAQSSVRSAPPNVPFLLIVGESGAGKSSLMRAGLAPRLTAPGVVPSVDIWRIAVMRVGDDPNPFLTLSKALFVENDDKGGFGAALPELRGKDGRMPEAFADVLAKGGGAEKREAAPAVGPILEALDRVQAREMEERKTQRQLRANLLLLVDQLENIFAQNVTDEQRSIFARLLFALCATRRVWVAATLRSDIYPRLITPGDFLALKDAGGVYDLAAPGESELGEIVYKSAAAAGLVYETDEKTGQRLDETILAYAQGKNTLPLLQFALERLFEERVQVGKEIRLTVDAYRRMGGLAGAINRTAEAALARLGKAEVAALPRLLRSLAVPVHDHGATTVGAADLTVRIVPRVQAVPDEATGRLVKALTDARIIVITGSEGGGRRDGEALIGIAHQRVFESWERARKIISEHREFFRIRDEVETQHRRWEKAKRPSALLLAKGVPLAEAQKIVRAHSAELSPEVCAYVAASNNKAQRFNIFMGATAAVFAVLAVLAFDLKLVADRNFETAQANQRIAEANHRTAEANFGVARETANNMIAATAQGLRNLQGISVTTINIVLGAIDSAVQKLKDSYPDNPLIDLSRAAVRFEFGKTYQATGNRVLAFKVARESFDIRSQITKYDQKDASPQAFEASPGDWRWELSNSIELLGDLYREDGNAAEARKRFLDVLWVRTRLVATSPDKDDWAMGLSLSYVRLGDLERSTDLAAARKYYELSLQNAADFFLRNPTSERWQRELSFDFNKVGDVKLLSGERDLKEGAPPIGLASALEDFNNSLCIRQSLAAKDKTDMKLKRDVSYTLVRIADAKLLLRDALGAVAANFYALAIRRELVDNDRNDARYIDDVATSLQRIAGLYRKDDPEKALAFYENAANLRSWLVERASNKNQAQANLEAVQKIIQSVRAQIDKDRLDALAGLWWQARVSETEGDFTRSRTPIDQDIATCWEGVKASVASIAGQPKAATATVR
ncbi:MAG: hypothetical protein ACHQAY_00105 [Hyphomicrobiales bacterium]